MIFFAIDYRTNVFTWGANTNFTLGHKDESFRQTPEMVEELNNDKTVSVAEVSKSRNNCFTKCV